MGITNQVRPTQRTNMFRSLPILLLLCIYISSYTCDQGGWNCSDCVTNTCHGTNAKTKDGCFTQCVNEANREVCHSCLKSMGCDICIADCSPSKDSLSISSVLSTLLDKLFL